MDMLQTILDSNGALGIQELCMRLELPRQSAHRILHQLLDLKLLQRHINGEQYTPGPLLRTLILKAAYQTQATGPWHSVLQALAKRTGETRSEEHTSELQSLMRISYAVFCLKKKKRKHKQLRLSNYTMPTITR